MCPKPGLQTTCDDVGQLLPLPKAGYWVEVNATSLLAESVRECMPPEACLAIAPGAPNATARVAAGTTCAHGYGGPGCAMCEQGHYRYGGECVKCESTLVSAFVWAMVGIVVFLPLLLKIGNAFDHFAAIDVSVTFMALSSFYAKYDLQWPELLKEWFKWQSVFYINLELLHLDCKSPSKWSYSEVFTTTLSIPLYMLMLMLFLWRLRFFGFSTFMRVYLSALQILYIFIITRSLEFFDCLRNEGDGKFYLRAEPSWECYVYSPQGGDWAALFPYGLAAVLVYPLGIPVLYISLLANAKLHFSEPLTIERLGFLYRHLAPEWYFWEVVVMARKLLVVATTMHTPMLFPNSSSRTTLAQALLAMLILLLFMVLQLHAQPYLIRRLSLMESVSYVSQLVLLMSGILYVSPIVVGSARTSLTVVNVIILLATYVALAMFLVLQFVPIFRTSLVAALMKVRDIYDKGRGSKAEKGTERATPRNSEMDDNENVIWSMAELVDAAQAGTHSLSQVKRLNGLRALELFLTPEAFKAAKKLAKERKDLRRVARWFRRLLQFGEIEGELRLTERRVRSFADSLRPRVRTLVLERLAKELPSENRQLAAVMESVQGRSLAEDGAVWMYGREVKYFSSHTEARATSTTIGQEIELEEATEAALTIQTRFRRNVKSRGRGVDARTGDSLSGIGGLTLPDLERLRKVYTAMDADESGSLSRAELSTVMWAMNMDEEEVLSVLSQISFDENLQVNFENFVRSRVVCGTRDAGHTKLVVSLLKAKEAFDNMDSSGDGTVDRVELENLLIKLGMAVAGASLTEMMDRIDDDGSGEISFGEFMSAIGEQKLHAVGGGAALDLDINLDKIYGMSTFLLEAEVSELDSDALIEAMPVIEKAAYSILKRHHLAREKQKAAAVKRGLRRDPTFNLGIGARGGPLDHHVMTAEQQSKLNKSTWRCVALAALAGGVSGMAGGSVELLVEWLFPLPVLCSEQTPDQMTAGEECLEYDSTLTFMTIPNFWGFWGVQVVAILVTTTAEIMWLYWDALYTACMMADITRLRLYPADAQRQFVASALTKAALELPFDNQIKFGINPLYGVSKFILKIGELAYKSKSGVTWREKISKPHFHWVFLPFCPIKSTFSAQHLPFQGWNEARRCARCRQGRGEVLRCPRNYDVERSDRILGHRG
mmetsp:Transcript_40863/g.130508  ORF Transcript_40863/g.130508 Transcript_40863/m.130508 type:complete len:1171 (-) Transcript_40863:761-4273(-)